MKESYIQPKTLTVYCSCELLFQTTRWWRFTSQHWVDWSRVWTDGFLHLALYRKKCRILYFMLTEGSRFSHYLCITITMIQFAINWGISLFTVKEEKVIEKHSTKQLLWESTGKVWGFFPQSEIERIQMKNTTCHGENWSIFISMLSVFWKWDPAVSVAR